MTHHPTKTVGGLCADDIGITRLIIRHEGSTLSGVLRNLEIDAETIFDGTWADPFRVITTDVRVTIKVGSITVGHQDRDHPCEVIA